MARVSMAKRDNYLQEKRESILDAAYPIFLKDGFEKTSIEKVANAAKMGKGSIYLYFKSKEDLFISLLKERSFLPQLKEMTIQPAETLDLQLRNIANGYLDFMETAMPFLYVLSAGAFQFPEYTRKIYREVAHQGTQYLKEIFSRFYPELKDKANISVLSILLFSSLFAYVLSQRLVNMNESTPITREEWVNEVVALFEARIQ